MHAVLLPNSPLERTVDLELTDWHQPGWPEYLALSVIHAGEAVHHEGQQYEVRPVTPPLTYKLAVVLPGGLGVYQHRELRTIGQNLDAHPVTWSEHLPAASLPKATPYR